MSAEAKPFGYWHQGDTDEESDFFLASESGNVGCAKCVTLYTGAEFDRLRAEMAGVREALEIAHDHIDMHALRISHCKDAALIDAARTPKEPDHG